MKRRSGAGRIGLLQEVFNDARLKVGTEQPADFFDVMMIDGDGTTVETTGRHKLGMDINYKNQWGYMVQTVSLAKTGEPLCVVKQILRTGVMPQWQRSPLCDHFFKG